MDSVTFGRRSANLEEVVSENSPGGLSLDPFSYRLQSNFPQINIFGACYRAEMQQLLSGNQSPTNISSGYNLSFTAASLRPELARLVAEAYLAVGDWELAKERVLASNALQCRTVLGAERQERELRRRLMWLTADQIALLTKATAEDRAALAWLAAVKHIQFAFEFATEVLREKLAVHDPILRHSDYETYVDLKALTHPQITELSGASKYKIRQVLLRMLREAGLLGKGSAPGTILRPVLSPAVVDVIRKDDARWLAGFLVPDTEIGRP
jgi:BrxA